MNAAVTVLLAAVGAVAASLGVLLPVIVAQGKSCAVRTITYAPT